MKTLILANVLLLTGCGTCTHACIMGFGPGNASFDAIAKYHNNQDPCQFIGKPQGYKTPGFCYSGQGKTAYIIQGNKINLAR